MFNQNSQKKSMNAILSIYNSHCHIIHRTGLYKKFDPEYEAALIDPDLKGN